MATTTIQFWLKDKFVDSEVKFELETSEGWWALFIEEDDVVAVFLSYHWHDNGFCRVYVATKQFKLGSIDPSTLGYWTMLKMHDTWRKQTVLNPNLFWRAPGHMRKTSPTCHAILHNARLLLESEKKKKSLFRSHDKVSPYCLKMDDGKTRLAKDEWEVATPFLIDQIIFATQQANKKSGSSLIEIGRDPDGRPIYEIIRQTPTRTTTTNPLRTTTTNPLGYITRSYGQID